MMMSSPVCQCLLPRSKASGLNLYLSDLIEEPSAEVNPFARKAGNENPRNPFARKAESSKTIQKSESFFDKIDTMDDDGGSKSKRMSLVMSPEIATTYCLI
jgi:hypothetical protein